MISSLKNLGKLGPTLMFLIPRLNSASKMMTAFCSIHISTIETGRSFTAIPVASLSARAILKKIISALK